jgi:hypothetical protein
MVFGCVSRGIDVGIKARQLGTKGPEDEAHAEPSQQGL